MSTAFAPIRKSFFAHRTAVLDPGARIGEGCKIGHFCHVYSNAIIGNNCVLGQNVMVAAGVVIGNHCRIQNNVSLFEGVVLEDYVSCGPSMVFTSEYPSRCLFSSPFSDQYYETRVKRGSSIGANATIICGVTLHECSFVAPGSVVIRDVPPYAMVAGIPAQVVGHMCERGERLAFDDQGLAVTSYGQAYRCAKDGRVTKVSQ